MNMFDPFSACLYCDDPVGNFEPGPRGGSSQNMTCRRCGARYNLAWIVGQAVRAGVPIGNPGEPLFLEVLSPGQPWRRDCMRSHCRCRNEIRAAECPYRPDHHA